ncbi:class I SAM-dependent methyltransferase [Desulfogranum marinum]|uniref:class I SAM-dependent methyltransferase n=1 Tax=Desulfogranum marinum TaxID=453220 RepID=UPI001963A57A|nr:class I SAM-dependent methyltransferase [Desulfogranum marinum]MBM9512987.1 class I SAM-dependent methyltransferase [Desulfogranum marinum]
MTDTLPWQIRMFRKTLKKQMRLRELTNLLTPIQNDEKCLLVTCGDNNGAMNYYLRELGGKWSWAELEEQSLEEMKELLQEDVLRGSYEKLDYEDQYFDRVVSIDCLEHIEDPVLFTNELHRITKIGGRVIITIPGGDQSKVVNKLKNVVGMTKESYGHIRDGLTVAELQPIMKNAGYTPLKNVTFSRFFTEMVELIINVLYVKILSKKSEAKVEEGTIAPATKDQLKSVEKSYKMYAIAYPFFKAISSLDVLLSWSEGYVTMTEGKRDA